MIKDLSLNLLEQWRFVLTRLRLLTAKEMERFLFSLGFNKVRQNGSHVFYRNADGRTTTLPHHSSKTLARPLIRAILREINVSVEAFDLVSNKF